MGRGIGYQHQMFVLIDLDSMLERYLRDQWELDTEEGDTDETYEEYIDDRQSDSHYADLIWDDLFYAVNEAVPVARVHRKESLKTRTNKHLGREAYVWLIDDNMNFEIWIDTSGECPALLIEAIPDEVWNDEIDEYIDVVPDIYNDWMKIKESLIRYSADQSIGVPTSAWTAYWYTQEDLESNKGEKENE